MTRILITALLFFSASVLLAQSEEIRPGDPAFRVKYAGYNFNGEFAAVIQKDAVNTYFLLDFSRIPSRFGRVWFMNLSFENYKVINIDPVVTEDVVCYMASRKYDERELLKLFDELKGKTAVIAATWTDGEKLQWLKEHDKYK